MHAPRRPSLVVWAPTVWAPTVWALAACALAACGASRPPPAAPAREEAYPTRLARPGTLPGDWALEQEVTIAHAEGSHTFRAVLEKRGDALLLLVLGPHGGRALAVRQEGAAVTHEQFVPTPLPFPPVYMLHDVHRVWLVPTPAPAPTDGARVREADGERVVERFAGGRLVERRFTRQDGQPPGDIVVTYEGGLPVEAPAAEAPPPVARLDNGWFGYRATIRTLGWTPLAPGARSEAGQEVGRRVAGSAPGAEAARRSRATSQSAKRRS